MGMRKDVLRVLRTLLDGVAITLSKTAADGTVTYYGNGRKLTVVNTLFDVAATNMALLPKIAIVPTPETIHTGLLGYTMDSTYRIAIFGYVCRHTADEELFDASEDVIEKIVQTLTDWTNVNTLLIGGGGFSVIEIGPILNEQFDEAGQIAYISVPITVQFVEH
jgi:hypothetical protein